MKLMTLLEIADLLAEILGFEDVTAGCIDASKVKALGVYQRDAESIRECIGGESSYQTAKLRILIHWGKNPTECEKKAHEIAELINAFDNIQTAEHTVIYADLKAIRAVGKDEKGICEYIVDADIIYTERNDL